MKIFEKILLAVVAASALFLTGCSSDTGALDGSWKTVALTDNGKEIKVVPSGITFTSDSKGYLVSGDSGVNVFNGAVNVKKDSFTIRNDFALTKRMGAPDEQAFEDLFIQALMNADTYKLEDNVLLIKDSKHKLEIKFVR